MRCGYFTAELLLASKSSPHLKLASVSVWARISATDESHARGKKRVWKYNQIHLSMPVWHTHICELTCVRFKDNKQMIYKAGVCL